MNATPKTREARMAEIARAFRKYARTNAASSQLSRCPVASPSSTPSSTPSQMHCVPTGWPALDRVLGAGGLARGALHEWFGVDAPEGASPPATVPPLHLLAHLAERATRPTPVTKRTSVLWIGRKVWPYPIAMSAALLERSVFVDPPDDRSRLRAIDLCLRARSVGAVVADARGLRMAESRRLQLAAQAGDTFALLARPSGERDELSVAATRWHVSRVANTGRVSWELDLLRFKGSLHRSNLSVAGRVGNLGRWKLELNDATGVVRELPDVVGRPVPTKRTAARVG